VETASTDQTRRGAMRLSVEVRSRRDRREAGGLAERAILNEAVIRE